MKKNLLFAFVIISIASSTKAQTFVCSPATSATSHMPFNTYTNLNIDMVNQTSDTMTLGWTLLENSLNPSWDYSVCDYTDCYTTLPPSSVMSPNFSTNSFLKLTINPMSIRGAGTLKFYVYDVNNTSSDDTVTFTVSSLTVGIDEKELASKLIFPNPAKSYISLNPGVKSVEIFSITGKSIYSASFFNGESKISLEGFGAGICLVKMELRDGSTLVRKLIIEK